MYVKVTNGIVTKEVEKPNWFMDNGDPVTDEYLIENEGIYPCVDIPPVINDLGDLSIEVLYLKPMMFWTVNETNVEKEYEILYNDLEQMKIKFINKVIELHDSYAFDGFYFTKTDSTILQIQSDYETRINIFTSTLASMANFRTENALFKIDESYVPLSNTDILLLSQYMESFIETCDNNANRLYGLIEDASSVGALQIINLLEGWPSNALNDHIL